MVRWRHRLNGHEFEQTPGDGEGQGSLAWCCSPWGRRESDTTEQLNNSNNNSPSEGPEEAAETRTRCNHEFPAIPQSCTVLTGGQILPFT